MNAKCPRCGVETSLQGNPFRPFCSERCKLIDLGNWISGKYRIPVKDTDEADESVPAETEQPEKE
jgi:endogenous inhibitor of DNA gyrase (YacG/DUF329 family)